jgi:hypothetical protein
MITHVLASNGDLALKGQVHLLEAAVFDVSHKAIA